MVNNPPTADDRGVPSHLAERRLVMTYAPAARRDGLAALLALDDALGAILRGGRDGMIGQMRLTWWHDALARLDDAPPPAEPVLQALATAVVPHVPGQRLAGLVEGWEELLDLEPLDAERLARYAEGRGARLFTIAGEVLAAGDSLAAAGRAWALLDLAAHVRDAATASLARSMAQPDLDTARGRRWSRPARALGALLHLSAMPDASPPLRAGRALWHRLTGR